MNQQFKRALGAMGLVAVAAALTACGGGGDSAGLASNGTADPYVGTWKSRYCYAGQGGFFKDTIVISKKGDKVYQVDFQIYQYGVNTCTGTGTAVQGDSFSFVNTIVGTKMVDGVLADKITYTDLNNATVKSVSYTDGKVLRVGDDQAAKDAEGFTNSFDTSDDEIFDKQ
jgi:hypothetical protein